MCCGRACGVAVVLCVLYPSVPGITGYWHGLLGYSQRARVDQAVARSPRSAPVR